MTISDSELIAITTGHQIDLIRFGSSVGSNVNPKLTILSKKVREILYEHDYLVTKTTTDSVSSEIIEYVTNELLLFTEYVSEEMQGLIKEEIEFEFNLAKGAVGFGTLVVRPRLKDVVALVNSKPIVLNGRAISVDDYIKGYANSQVEAIKSVIIGGWADGLTTRQIAQNITGTNKTDGVFQQSQRSAYMMSKDITSHISSQVKAQVGYDNQDIIVGEKVLVTLDSRTSPICQKLGSQDNGGKEFYYKTDGENFTRPPFHHFCRSTMKYILSPEYQEISEEGATRTAVVEGKAIQVNANTNWLDLAKEHPMLAEQSLGKERAKVLASMTAQEFTKEAYNRMNEPLTLDKMKENNNKIAGILN